jgi:hypothetical protein
MAKKKKKTKKRKRITPAKKRKIIKLAHRIHAGKGRGAKWSASLKQAWKRSR